MQRDRLLLWCAVMVVAMLSPPSSVTGQEVAGRLVGQVLDEGGIPVVEATVEVVGGEGSRQRATDRDGRFFFPSLSAGSYRLTVRHPGFRPAEREDVVIRGGETTPLELVLTTLPIELEGLNVIVPPIVISRTETEYSTKLNETEIELLPVGYDVNLLISQTPGARPEQVWGGATAQANNYRLDGLAANHPGIGGGLVEPSISWIESIEVRGLGAGAEHGNFQGGLIDITTKSGTNRVRGAVRTNGENQILNGSNLGGNEIGSEVHGRYDVEGELRGPLVKDHLFYFVAGQWVHTDRRHLNHLRSFDSRFLPALEEKREGKLFGKLTWRPTPRDRVDLTGGHIHLQTDHYGQSGYEAPAASWRLTAPTTFYSANWQHSWGSRGVLEAGVASFTRDEERAPYEGGDVPGIQTFGLRPPYASYQNAALRFRHAPASLSTSVKVALNFATLGLDHLLKVGGDYSSGSFIDERVRNGGMTWRPPRMRSLEPDDPSSWAFSSLQFVPSTWGGEVRLHAEVENAAAYLQDHVSIGSRFAISPGVRFGRWRGWLTPGDGRSTRFLAVEDEAVDPRVGMTLDLTGDNSLVAKGHWGRYHQSLMAQMFDRVAGGNVFSNEQLWYYRGELFDDPRTRFTEDERDRLAEEGIFTLEEEIILNETGPVDNYRQPYVDQWVVGLEKTFGDKVKFEAVYLNRRNHQMVALLDRNRDSNYAVYEHVRVLDAGGQPLLYNGVPLKLNRVYIPLDVIRHRLELIAAGRCDGCSIPPGFSLSDTTFLSYDPDYVLTNVPDARRELDQLQLSLEVALATWGGTVSVVFTSLKGNLDNVTGYDDPAGFGAGPYVRVNESVNSQGFLDNFADRELKLSVYGQLPWQLRAGVFWQYATGDHYSPRFTLSGLEYRYRTFDGQEIDHRFIGPLAGHNVFVGQRGYREYPIRATIDARLEREFQLGDAAWVVTLEGYNLFNAANVTEYNTSVNRGKNFYSFLDPHLGGTRGLDPNEYFQAVRARVPPRVVRLGMGFRF